MNYKLHKIIVSKEIEEFINSQSYAMKMDMEGGMNDGEYEYIDFEDMKWTRLVFIKDTNYNTIEMYIYKGDTYEVFP